ncbi:MAG: Uncharacterised protein [Opitutia bacterium UBA7350]|nr:MAG: Uncharacterised protein [Opitutae bacterium UBA7350]
MKNIPSILTFVLLFGFSHVHAENLIAGWNAWGGSNDTDYVNSANADELLTGFSGSMGSDLISAYPTLGGGHYVVNWGSSSVTDYGGFASSNISANSFRIGVRETNNAKMLDFQITNNSGSSYALDSIYFDHLWTAAADSTGFTIKHNSSISDLLASGSVNLGSVADPGVNTTWSDGVVDFSSNNYVLADGQSFGFRLELDHSGNNSNNIFVDNVAITGVAVVPEPGTFAMVLGLFSLALVVSRRRK